MYQDVRGFCVILVGATMLLHTAPADAADPAEWAGTRSPLWALNPTVAHEDQEQLHHEHAGHGGNRHGGLHLTHPLVAESPSPDTKIRVDYIFSHEDRADTHTARLEAEYAFARWISVEVDLPYTVVDLDGGPRASDLDTIEVGVKLAWFGLEDHGVLLGGGIEFGLPTGDDGKGIGSDNELEIEPFIDAGYRDGPLEVVAFLSFVIPTNEADGEKDEVDLELGYNLALTYHVSPTIAVLWEFDGEAVASGDEEESVLNVGPGIKLKPDEHGSLEVGLSVSWPVTDDKGFDVRTLLSVFYHY